MNSVPEKDWKVFRELHSVVLDRFCQQILDDVRSRLSHDTKNPHETYLSLYKLIQRCDKEVAEIFNDFRRSTAFWQIAMMHARELLTEEEFALFSAETRNSIMMMRDIRRGNAG